MKQVLASLLLPPQGPGEEPRDCRINIGLAVKDSVHGLHDGHVHAVLMGERPGGGGGVNPFRHGRARGENGGERLSLPQLDPQRRVARPDAGGVSRSPPGMHPPNAAADSVDRGPVAAQPAR